LKKTIPTSNGYHLSRFPKASAGGGGKRRRAVFGGRFAPDFQIYLEKKRK
jgi:hypothetical protein